MNIEFKEHYIDEKPEGNYWRGIQVLINDVVMLEIMYAPPHGFAIRDKVIPFRLFKNNGEEVRLFNPTDSIENKEDAKKRAEQICNDYFNFFKQK